MVILDTDIASSVDDLVTMSCLYHMADKGKVNFAAIMVNHNGDTNAKMAALYSHFGGYLIHTPFGKLLK